MLELARLDPEIREGRARLGEPLFQNGGFLGDARRPEAGRARRLVGGDDLGRGVAGHEPRAVIAGQLEIGDHVLDLADDFGADVRRPFLGALGEIDPAERDVALLVRHEPLQDRCRHRIGRVAEMAAVELEIDAVLHCHVRGDVGIHDDRGIERLPVEALIEQLGIGRVRRRLAIAADELREPPATLDVPSFLGAAHREEHLGVALAVVLETDANEDRRRFRHAAIFGPGAPAPGEPRCGKRLFGIGGAIEARPRDVLLRIPAALLGRFVERADADELRLEVQRKAAFDERRHPAPVEARGRDGNHQIVPSLGWKNGLSVKPQGSICLRMRLTLATNTGFSSSSVVAPRPAS